MKRPEYSVGTAADDDIRGALYVDNFIFGLEGDDKIGDPHIADAYLPTNDRYFGGEGNDTLYSHAGTDRLFGNTGDDLAVIVWREGVVRYDGGDGADVARLLIFDAPVVVDKGDKTVIFEDGCRVILTNVEAWEV